MPISYWKYDLDQTGIRHIGPEAQNFSASFNVGGNPNWIHNVDMNGVNMAAIQALNEKVIEKDIQLDLLQKQLNDLILKLDT